VGEAKRKAELRAPRILPDTFGRFVICHPSLELAWTGSHWGGIDSKSLLPDGDFQICNFATVEEALVYLGEHSAEIKNRIDPPIWMPPASTEAVAAEGRSLLDDVDKRVLDEENRSPFSSLTLTSPGPNHWNDPEPEPNSFRCPHCGAWRPAYGFSMQAATLPNVGIAQLLAIFCGTCRVFLQIQVISLDDRPVRGRPS
jgi:hypothetical protein